MFLKIKQKILKKPVGNNENIDNSKKKKKNNNNTNSINNTNNSNADIVNDNNNINININNNNNNKRSDSDFNEQTLVYKARSSSDIESSETLVENEDSSPETTPTTTTTTTNSQTDKPSIPLNRNKSFIGTVVLNIKKKSLSRSTDNKANRKSYQKENNNNKEPTSPKSQDDDNDNDNNNNKYTDDESNDRCGCENEKFKNKGYDDEEEQSYESDNDYIEEGEEYEDNSEDADDEYISFKNIEIEDYQNTKSKKNLLFNCLSPDQLVEQQEKEIKDIAELLSIPNSSANILLKHFNWKREELVLKYFESPKEICKELGIEYNPIINYQQQQQQISPSSSPQLNSCQNTTTTTTTTTSNNSVITLYNCSICGEENEDIGQFTTGKCKHTFCNDCWANYITLKINEGEATIRCPFFKCKAVVDDQIIKRLIAPFVYEKYQVFSTKKYTQQNKQLRYCPTPGCDNAITLTNHAVDNIDLKNDNKNGADLNNDSNNNNNNNNNNNISVECSCGFKFCFKCHRGSHAPATCEQMSQWEQKCSDESETSHWKIANCKSCPKCNVAVEKNGGCMHVVCSQCKYEWCWMCSHSWKGHADYYTCNRHEKKEKKNNNNNKSLIDNTTTTKRLSTILFGGLTGKSSKKSKESIEEEQKRINKLELERYLYYYEKFVSYENSQKMEKTVREEAKIKMTEFEKYNSTWAEVQYIEKGVEQLLDCRNILKYTYIYAFFSFSDYQTNQRVITAKELFEFLQDDLEKTMQKLTEQMEDVMKSQLNLETCQRLEIMNYITLLKTKTDGLLNAVQKDSLFEF